MPFSSLNRIRMDRQTASSGARQQWTGLPEGASLWSRLGGFTHLSNPSRFFAVETETLARRPASPCTGRSRALHRLRRSRRYRRDGGYLEDGVPHAEALSPANRLSPIRRGARPARSVEEFALAVSALATTPQISSM
jgi:hypothetical protein